MLQIWREYDTQLTLRIDVLCKKNLLQSLHENHFPNTYRKQCVEKSDCVRSGFIELQSFSLSRLQIAPIYCTLVNSSSIFVHYDSGFVQIVLNFFRILIVVHRVHGCEKH